MSEALRQRQASSGAAAVPILANPGVSTNNNQSNVMCAPRTAEGATDTAAAYDKVVAARLAVAGGQPRPPLFSARVPFICQLESATRWIV